MKIVILGSGLQGTLYSVRLASAGHAVTLIARGRRAMELRTHGAIVEHALTGEHVQMGLPVLEELQVGQDADLCLVTVRRALLGAAPGLPERGILLRATCQARNPGDGGFGSRRPCARPFGPNAALAATQCRNRNHGRPAEIGGLWRRKYGALVTSAG